MLTTLLTIALLHWLLLITPGANVLLVSQLAASGHRTAALHASVGIGVVAVIWALLAVLGINALFAAHASLRLIVQVAGGLYLCYIAVKLWRAGSTANAQRTIRIAPWAAFRMGFITNITNPASAFFFGSVFATALPASPSTPLLVAAVTLVLVNALTCHLFLAIAFSHAKIQAGYDRQRTLLNRVAGSLVGVYGIRLLAVAADEARTRGS